MHYTIPVLILFIGLLLNITFAMYVLTRNPSNKLYQSYFFMQITFILWNIEGLAMHAINDYGTALFWIKVFAAGPNFISPAFFYFIILLTNKTDKKYITILNIDLAISFLCTLSLWIGDLNLKGLSKLPDGSYFIIIGDYKIVNAIIMLHFLVLPLYGIYLLYREYNNCSISVDRHKYYTVIVGFFIALFGGIVDLVFTAMNKGGYPIGKFTIVFFSMLIAVAILKYHLMDIEIVIKRTAVYSTVFTVITALFLITITTMEYFARKFFNTSSFLLTAALIALLTLFSQPLRDKIYYIIDHYFFKEKYEQQDTIFDFSQRLTAELDKEQVIDLIIKTINKVLPIDKVGIMLNNPTSKTEDCYSLASTYGIEKLQKNKLQSINQIYKYFDRNKNNSKVILKDMLEENAKISLENRELLNELNNLNSSLILPITIKDKFLGFISLGNKLSGDLYHSYDFKILNAICNESAVAIENAMLYTDLRDNFFNTVRSLTTAIEAKDSYTRGHCDRVSNYATGIAKYMNLTETTIDNIRIGGILHDVGKIGVPDEILLKKSALTPMEFEDIMKHPNIGVSILREAKFPEEIMDIIKYHHEKVNGTGYPEHLIGDEIPLNARIVSVADVFEAITSDRAYRKAFTFDEAKMIMNEGRGQLFDTTIVEIFLDILDEQKRRSEES